MNKFTIEADGDSIDVKLVKLESGDGNKLIIGGYTLSVYSDADEFFNILCKAYEQNWEKEYRNMCESYEVLREETERLSVERDNLRNEKDTWRAAYVDKCKAEKNPPAKVGLTAEEAGANMQAFALAVNAQREQPTPPQPANSRLNQASLCLQELNRWANKQSAKQSPTPPQPARKIVQVSGGMALCNDGTMWYPDHTNEWHQFPPIPQATPCD